MPAASSARRSNITAELEAAALALVEEKIRANTEVVLGEVRRIGALPRAAALALTTERVFRAMRTRRRDAALA
jgi:hypothetical protein